MLRKRWRVGVQDNEQVARGLPTGTIARRRKLEAGGKRTLRAEAEKARVWILEAANIVKSMDGIGCGRM